MSDYLLEIGLEEIPARFILDISQQLENLVSEFLQENRLSFTGIQKFSTPRRLAIRVLEVADKQEDLAELVKGPSLKIAKDAEGNWSKAALGFLRGQGATEDAIEVQSIKGEDYIFVNKFTPGLSSKEVLKDIYKVIPKMNFPVSMRWNAIETSFIRPIHWFVSLLDDEVIPFTYLNIKAGRLSYGHRFLGHTVEISKAQDYEASLKGQFVMVDFDERQALIRQQISEIAQKNAWLVPIDQDLLDEVTSIVEWPTAFFGEFESKYLEIPAIISITAMMGHQRYFYVMNEEKQLLPYFISVRNGNDNHIENVVRGNLKVLKARLEDALFFYQEDLKRPLEEYVNKLTKVNEHYKLGTFADKQDRMSKMIESVKDFFDLDASELTSLQRAAKIYKFDLMTNVVDEFSELQGQIGEIYARHYGETEEVAEAIGSQYLPNSSGGALPQGKVASILAILDKLDTIYQYFNVGMIPTGSNDPYALRRQSMGMVEIMLANRWNFEFSQILDIYESLFNQAANQETKGQFIDFMKARMNQLLSKQNIDYDIINAATSAKNMNVFKMYETALSLQDMKSRQPEMYRSIMEAMTRMVNLGINVEATDVKPDLSQSDSETAMIQFVTMNQFNHMEAMKDHYQANIQVINQYFDNNMVNHEDEAIKNNRLATMGMATQSILNYLDPREIITKF